MKQPEASQASGFLFTMKSPPPPPVIPRWSLKNLFVMGCVALSFYILYSAAFRSLGQTHSVPPDLTLHTPDGQPIELIHNLGEPFFLYIGPVDRQTYLKCLESTSPYRTYLIPVNIHQLPRVLGSLEGLESSPRCVLALVSAEQLRSHSRRLGISRYPAVLEVGGDFSILNRIEP